jgi:hypothetical protein
VTYGYLDQIPFRDAQKPHGEIGITKKGSPSKEGNLLLKIVTKSIRNV